MGTQILFVDDDKDWRFLAETTLTEAGYEVLTAEDASDAMVKIEGRQVPVIVLDLNLGGEDGGMLLKFLKQNNPDSKIIIYTGMEQDGEAIMKLLDLGAFSYVRKGPAEDLTRAVEEALQ
jgi:DNA-binding NtrC family response regulator